MAEQVLQQFKDGKLSMEEVQKQLNEINKANRKILTYKISAKGAISFYGIRRMPITLYKDELDQIVEASTSDEFLHFIEANRNSLSIKEPKEDKKEGKKKEVTKSVKLTMVKNE